VHTYVSMHLCVHACAHALSYQTDWHTYPCLQLLTSLLRHILAKLDLLLVLEHLICFVDGCSWEKHRGIASTVKPCQGRLLWDPKIRSHQDNVRTYSTYIKRAIVWLTTVNQTGLREVCRWAECSTVLQRRVPLFGYDT
jgi:hypothetical protein